ncbi:MAG: hypothetical protein KIT73_05620 [Burkholderiales bacterium]|nr:hypothetical protein [Burkholderiales bacterium]
MSRTPICIRFVVPLLLAAPVAAHALQGDRIRPYVGGVYNYYSNLFYLDDSLQNSQVSFLKDGQRHDMSYGLRAGVDADIPWSRQNFVIRTQITDTKYVTYDQLDYLGYNARGTWNWAIGDKWDGDLGASFVQSLGTFTDFQGTGGRTKNVRKQEEFYGSAMYRLTYDLKLRAAVRNVKLKNEAANFQQFDRDDMIYEVGPRYYSKGGENFLGLTLRMTDGKFPNRQVLPGSMLDNGYKEYSMLGVVDYRYSGETSLRGELGWTERRNDQLSQRDFDGVTGRLNVTYSPSGVVGVFASVFREIGAFQDVTTNHILTQASGSAPATGTARNCNSRRATTTRGASFWAIRTSF